MTGKDLLDAFGINAVIAVLIIVTFFLLIPGGKEEKDSSTPKLRFNLGASLVFLGIIWMIANGQLLAYTTFGSQFFQFQIE